MRIEMPDRLVPLTCDKCEGTGILLFKIERTAKNFWQRIKNFFENQFEYRDCDTCSGTGKKIHRLPGEYEYYNDEGIRISSVEYLHLASLKLPEEERQAFVDKWEQELYERSMRLELAEINLKLLDKRGRRGEKYGGYLYIPER